MLFDSFRNGDLPGDWIVHSAAKVVLAGFVVFMVLAVVVGQQVSVGIVVRGDGSIEPQEVYEVRSMREGLVTDVLVKSGESVTVGQPLVMLDSLEATTQIRELERRRQSLMLGIEVEDARLPIDSIERAERLASAQARRVAARASLRAHLTDHRWGNDIDSLLGAYKPGSHVQIDRAVADVQMADAELRQAAAQLGAFQITRYQARQKGLELAQIQLDLSLLQTQRTRLVVTSPSNGLVLTERIDLLKGRVVSAGEHLFDVGQQSAWQARISLGASDVGQVRQGTSAQVEIPAFRSTSPSLFRGRVAYVPLQATNQPNGSEVQNYRVTIDLDPLGFSAEQLHQLRRGLPVRGFIIVDQVSGLGLARRWIGRTLRGQTVILR